MVRRKRIERCCGENQLRDGVGLRGLSEHRNGRHAQGSGDEQGDCENLRTSRVRHAGDDAEVTCPKQGAGPLCTNAPKSSGG